MDRRGLREEQIRPIQWQVAIDLVGTHLVVPDVPVHSTRVHHCGRADDVGSKEHTRILYRPIDV